MHNIQKPYKNKFLFLFHKNACSLNKNFDDFQHLLSCTKSNFDIIGRLGKKEKACSVVTAHLFLHLDVRF